MYSNGMRITREKKTVEAMIRIYCSGKKHSSNNLLCPECGELLEYAKTRLDKCPFQERKTTCSSCLIHCYSPQMREKVKRVMRYSGPRMLWKHPTLALLHAIDGLDRHRKTE